MSDARKILRDLAEARSRDNVETERWEAYRRLCGPPRWFLLLVFVLGIVSVVLVVEAVLTAKDAGAVASLGRIAVFVYAFVWPPLLFYIENRRRRGLRRILEQEAPELAVKLAEERILK